MNETMMVSHWNQDVCSVYKHKSGLTVYLYPMKGSKSTFALFGTYYGSIDRTFKTKQDADFVTVPDGVAHFLEHKLFESEEGDAFTLFAKTGASANAYTSFDRTAYLFSCTQQFEESLGALLNFVQSPYFTRETVQKEQGIIGQEIRMYQDDPDWKVFFNCLGALYHRHPVNVDITGTVESIAKIDKDLLYRCYRTFYNKNNMALCIAGQFEPERVCEIIDRCIQSDANLSEIERRQEEEPASIHQKRVQEALSISMPQFCMGIKLPPIERGTQRLQAETESGILLEALAGESSALFQELYEAGEIRGKLQTEVFSGDGYFSWIIQGEAPDPDAVYQRICAQIEKMKKEGIAKETFERVKRSLYGQAVFRLNRADDVANQMFAGFIGGYSLFDPIGQLARTEFEKTQDFLSRLSDGQSVLSIIVPAEE